MEYTENHFAVDLVTGPQRAHKHITHSASDTLVNNFDRVSPNNFGGSLDELVNFIEGRATFVGWYKQGDGAFLGTAVIEVSDKSVIAELEEQTFVAPIPPPGHPRMIGKASEMAIHTANK